jgi:thiamine biosynthesis lipoprotein
MTGMPIRETHSSFCSSLLFLLAALVLIAATLAGCNRPRTYENQFLAFGTLIEITIFGTEHELAEKAFEAAQQDFEFMHKTWHAWQPSALTRANALIAAGKSFDVDPDLLPLIARAKPLSKQSQGLFNPAAGKLIELWGFHSDEYAGRRPPPDKKIKVLVARSLSMDDLVLKGTRLSSSNRAVQLDFGAFAKGYGVGQVAEHLRRMGIENLIVNAGGDLRAIGAHGNRPWRIGIRHPRQGGIIASVEISKDECVFTSGDYERYFEFKGRRYHHILDPRSGYPARGTTSVTVIHPDAGTADAAATALFVAGPDQWRRVARAMGVRDALLIDRRGRAHMSLSMAERIEFEVDPPPPIIVRNENP